jgi:hypothetical protein
MLAAQHTDGIEPPRNTSDLESHQRQNAADNKV